MKAEDVDPLWVGEVGKDDIAKCGKPPKSIETETRGLKERRGGYGNGGPDRVEDCRHQLHSLGVLKDLCNICSCRAFPAGT